MLMTHTSRTNVQSVGVGTTITGTIAANAQAFSLLTAQLYRDPALAIVRELSTNALDAHIRAGRPNTPFVWTLPTRLDPVLSLRDYGTGITPTVMRDIYSRMFESDKGTSGSTEIGGIGLGGKTPFAYKGPDGPMPYTIQTYIGGHTWIYHCYLDNGVPAYTLMAEGPTDEQDGTRITLTIQEGDVDIFNNALRVLETFEPRPIIKGRDEETALQLIPPPLHSCPDYIKTKANRRARKDIQFLLGPISYPVEGPKSWGGDAWPEGSISLWNYITSNMVERDETIHIRIPLPTDGVSPVDITPARDSLVLSKRTAQTCAHAMAQIFKKHVATKCAQAASISSCEEVCHPTFEFPTNIWEKFFPNEPRPSIGGPNYHTYSQRLDGQPPLATSRKYGVNGRYSGQCYGSHSNSTGAWNHQFTISRHHSINTPYLTVFGTEAELTKPGQVARIEALCRALKHCPGLSVLRIPDDPRAASSAVRTSINADPAQAHICKTTHTDYDWFYKNPGRLVQVDFGTGPVPIKMWKSMNNTNLVVRYRDIPDSVVPAPTKRTSTTNGVTRDYGIKTLPVSGHTKPWAKAIKIKGKCGQGYHNTTVRMDYKQWADVDLAQLDIGPDAKLTLAPFTYSEANQYNPISGGQIKARLRGARGSYQNWSRAPWGYAILHPRASNTLTTKWWNNLVATLPDYSTALAQGWIDYNKSRLVHEMNVAYCLDHALPADVSGALISLGLRYDHLDLPPHLRFACHVLSQSARGSRSNGQSLSGLLFYYHLTPRQIRVAHRTYAMLNRAYPKLELPPFHPERLTGTGGYVGGHNQCKAERIHIFEQYLMTTHPRGYTL